MKPVMQVVAFMWALGHSLLLAGDIYPEADWNLAEPAEVGLDEVELRRAQEYALQGGGAGMVVYGGRVVAQWGDTDRQYDLKSTSKSIGVTALGLALADEKLALEDRVSPLHDSLAFPPDANTQTGWIGEITVLHLATQTAGFAKPGGFEPLLFEPGTAWHYSDGGPNWLAECLTRAYEQSMEELLFARVFQPIGIQPEDLRWRNNQYRPHRIDGLKRCEFGSGVHANVDAMARIGLLYLRRGKWREQQLLPANFVDLVRQPHSKVKGLPTFNEVLSHTSQGSDATQSHRFGAAANHYGLLWWNNADGTLADVPRDAYWSWGLYDSLIVVIPSLDLVVSRAGKSWPRRSGAGHYEVLQPFLGPIVAALPRGADTTEGLSKAPYPVSSVIRNLRWQPRDQILRLAPGSDNWPVTWADDDQLYTAYGDGWGFEPKVERKLSLGLAKISGSPDDGLIATNLRSPVEQLGQGADGQKASGLLSINGILYMWVRNARNSQLLWSSDHGLNWNRCRWKFTESFGCPTFLNAGRDYADAQDDFVYIYSPDSDSAYDPADQMILARVPARQILERGAYRFFAGVSDGEARWSTSMDQRVGVFEHQGKCYRSGISYCKPLSRYLWCQTMPQSEDLRGPRFEGGFGIYESKTPWGPWFTVFYTEHWDVGPGETSCLPCKWMDRSGESAYLLFSGEDSFSVRGVSWDISSRR